MIYLNNEKDKSLWDNLRQRQVNHGENLKGKYPRGFVFQCNNMSNAEKQSV